MAEERVPLTSLEVRDDSFSVKKKPKAREHESFCDAKLVSFVIVGILTGLYVIAELAVAVYIHSLVLLSDGFHNLSDCVSLYIAFWARRAGKKGSSDAMSYGWARTEILGGLTNGCFLLSLCLYVVLEAIPKFIEPEPMVGGWLFMVIAGCGLFINTFGTILFAITGQAHAHGHSHSHGHGHGHGHGDKKKKKEKENHEMSDSQKKEKKEKKEKHGHDHGHGHEHKDKKDKKEKKEKHGHDHGHGHKDGKKEKKAKRDMNTHAVFLHYLGDAISSLMVLGAGILLHFFHGKWIDYIDPVSSLLICGLILYTTIPLVKRCSMILLQSTPGEVSLPKLREKLLKVEGVIGLHDLHVWQLVDGMTIASVHVLCEEGSDFSHLVKDVKKVFHDKGIHSSSIQPEFVPRNNAPAFCNQNCVKECEEDWCCKKVADITKSTIEEYAITTPVV